MKGAALSQDPTQLITTSAWARVQPVEQEANIESQHHSQGCMILPAAPGTCQAEGSQLEEDGNRKDDNAGRC